MFQSVFALFKNQVIILVCSCGLVFGFKVYLYLFWAVPANLLKRQCKGIATTYQRIGKFTYPIRRTVQRHQQPHLPTDLYTCMWFFIFIFFKNGPIPASYCLFLLFSRYNFNKWKKRRWSAWDSNPEPQDGRRRRNHGAMAATTCNWFKTNLHFLLLFSLARAFQVCERCSKSFGR